MKPKTITISSNDDHIVQKINEMHFAFEEDRRLNRRGLPATHKIGMMDDIRNLLLMEDQSGLLENQVLPALAEWLTPMPNGSLPHVRTEILKIIFMHYKKIPQDYIKDACFVKVLQRLGSHRAENKDNRKLIQRILNEWAHAHNEISYDERVNMRNERNVVVVDMIKKPNKSEEPKKDLGTVVVKPKNPLANDLKWQTLQRARVPHVALREYVNRPQLAINVEENNGRVQKYAGLTRNERIMKIYKGFKRTQN